MDINKLEQQIDSQSRNGRQTIYVKVSDMIELDANYSTIPESDRVFVDKTRLEDLIRKYKRENSSFMKRIKCDVSSKPVQQNSKIQSKMVEQER